MHDRNIIRAQHNHREIVRGTEINTIQNPPAMNQLLMLFAFFVSSSRITRDKLHCYFPRNNRVTFRNKHIAMSMSKARKVTMSTFPRGKTDAPLTLFVYATMNGYKGPILCEELGIDYNYVTIDFEKGEQKSPEYLAINPNGRIPAIYDADHDIFIAESAAILEYIATKYCNKNPALLPSPEDDPSRHWEIRQWMLFSATGLSPAMGNAMFFNRIAATKGEVNQYSIERYTNESRRCLQVLNDQLKKSGAPFLLGRDLTIADVNAFTYASTHFWAKVSVDGLNELNAWIKLLMERPAFQRGLEIPFARRGFFGPPYATEEEIEAEIARNAGQFTVSGGSAAAGSVKK